MFQNNATMETWIVEMVAVPHARLKVVGIALLSQVSAEEMLLAPITLKMYNNPKAIKLLMATKESL